MHRGLRFVVRRFVIDAVALVRNLAGAQEPPHHLKETETHQVGAERDAQIDDPARPFEFRRDLIRIELVNIGGAERADNAGKQRPAQESKDDHGLARRRRQLFDKDIDADMDAGAHAERGAEFRHPHEHVGGKLVRPGKIDRGELGIDPVGSFF